MRLNDYPMVPVNARFVFRLLPLLAFALLSISAAVQKPEYLSSSRFTRESSRPASSIPFWQAASHAISSVVIVVSPHLPAEGIIAPQLLPRRYNHQSLIPSQYTYLERLPSKPRDPPQRS